MLAVTTPTLPADPDAWAAEVKRDGYRALRFVGRVDHGLLAPTRRRLAGSSTPSSPFQRPIPAGGRWGQGPEPAAVFVHPKLAVRVHYLGWEAGRLRHAASHGVA